MEKIPPLHHIKSVCKANTFLCIKTKQTPGAGDKGFIHFILKGVKIVIFTSPREAEIY